VETFSRKKPVSKKVAGIGTGDVVQTKKRQKGNRRVDVREGLQTRWLQGRGTERQSREEKKGCSRKWYMRSSVLGKWGGEVGYTLKRQDGRGTRGATGVHKRESDGKEIFNPLCAPEKKTAVFGESSTGRWPLAEQENMWRELQSFSNVPSEKPRRKLRETT